jgi:hypothetical protein
MMKNESSHQPAFARPITTKMADDELCRHHIKYTQPNNESPLNKAGAQR